MKAACKVLVSLVLLQGAAWAQTPAPEIQIVDGKVTMSAQGVPLGRLLSLLDRAVGLNSTVKPELSNRNISVRFTDLPVKDAVHKIFEGQPLNYMFVEGKGISRIELVDPSATTATGTSSSALNSGPIFNQTTPLSGITPNPSAPPLAQPGVVQPLPQPPNANNAPFGSTSPAPAGAASSSSGGVAPGQMPPAVGVNNPLVTPAGAQAPPPNAGFPIIATPPPQQTGPGTLGATPGVIR